MGAGLAEVPYDNPGALRGARAHIDEARAAAIAEAAKRPSSPPDHFMPGEHAVSIKGAPGWRGYASPGVPCCNPAAYGYRIDGFGALAYVPGPTDHQAIAHGYANFDTITIECRPERQPHCRIRVPFDGGNGAFVIDSDGGRADAKLCVEGLARPLHGWSLMQAYAKSGWKLQPDGCAGPATAAALTSMMHEHDLAAVAPGENSDGAAHISWRAELHLALTLTSFLSRHMQR